MTATVTRRSLARASTVSALAILVADSAMRKRIPSPGVAVAQDEPTVAVAMLDRHAEKLEPLFDIYSEQAGIDVEITPFEYEDLYRQASLALTQQASTFDVVSLQDAWIPQFASLLSPFDDAVVPSEQIVPVATELTRYPAESQPCGVPWLGDAQFFVSRIQWLESSGFEPPETWDAVIASANNLAVPLENDSERGAFAISTLSAHQLVDSFLPVLRGFGTDLIDPKTGVPQLDTPAALGAINAFQSLAAISPAESGATGAPSNAERFQAGAIAMMSNFWSSDLLEAANVEQLSNAGPIVCAMQPAQGTVLRLSMTGVWIGGIPIGSEKQELARPLLAWLTSAPVQRQLVELNLPPVLAPIYIEDHLVAAQPQLPQLLDLLASSTPRPRSPYYPQLEQLLAIELASMLDGEQTGDDAMRNANIALREFLAREGVLSV